MTGSLGGARTHQSGSGVTQAMVLNSPGNLELQEIQLPTVENDDAILRVEACGLCGTDHEQFSGLLPSSNGVIPGHETVGIIEQIGPLASKRWGVGIGDRVAVEVFQSCRECYRCKEGEYRRCERHGIGDMYGFIPMKNSPGLWGGYARHQYLSLDSKILRIPKNLDPVIATLFNPLGAGIRWGVTLPGTTKGDIVAILGPGIRGLSAAAATKSAGAGMVLVVGKGPADAERLGIAPRFGADMVVDSAVEDPVKALYKATGALADVVVDVTAGAPEALVVAINIARPGATVVVAGTRGDVNLAGFQPDLIVYKELRILGALGVDTPAYTAAVDLIASGVFPFEELPRVIAPLDVDEVSSLLRSMGGRSNGPRPIHGVIVP